jgi:quinol monooxygenase YgiN
MFRSILSVAGSAIFIAVLLSAPPAASAADEPITISARFYPAPGREAEAEARLLQVVAYVRKAEPGAIYRLHRSSNEPTAFLFYETYASQAALEQHSKVTLPAFGKEYGPTPEGLWARPPAIETFRELARQ